MAYQVSWGFFFNITYILVEQRGTIYSIAEWIWGFYTFLKDLSPKVKLMVRLEFEPASFDAVVNYINYYVRGTSSIKYIVENQVQI